MARNVLMSRHVLVEKNNKLYIMAEDTAYSTPILQRLYYPLNYQGTAAKFARDYGAHRIGQEVTYNRVRGAYMDADLVFYVLQNGGNTCPDIIEETPLPCPKVRRGIETRYSDGRWQKLLKEGWVDA